MSRVFIGGLILALVVCSVDVATAQDAAAASSDLDALRQQADVAYRNRDFTRALGYLDRVLAQAPKDHVSLYLRGSCRVELGIESANVELIRQGINDSREAIGIEGAGKTVGKPEYYLPYIYGMSHLAALENRPAHAKTAQTVADTMLEREDLTPEQRANVYFQRAQADLQMKDYSACEADLGKAIELVPKHLAAHMLSTEVAIKSKSPAEAVAAFGRVVSAFPDHALVYNNRGMYLQSLGRSQEAIADFNKAIELDDKFIPAYINRGYSSLELGNAADAEKSFNEALAIEPNHIGALNMRARTRMAQKRMGEALTDYRKIVELAPGTSAPLADLGFAQFFAADYPGALQSFRSALKLDPKLRFLEPWKLACEIRVSPNGQADQSAYQATLSKPEGSRDWPDSLILFQLGRLDAIQLIKATHPTDKKAQTAQLCEGYYFIGMEQLRRGQTQSALAYFQQAVQQKLPDLSAYRGAMVVLNNSGAVAR